MTKNARRYNSFAIILHWIMALAFFAMLGSGVVMTYGDLEPNQKFELYQLHKSGGVILLIAFFIRIGWRFLSQIPPLPSRFSKLDKIGAKLGHWGLYALMITMPLTGWAMVSSSVYGLPTYVFGLFEWPHIPGLEANEAVNALSKDAHFILAIVFGLTIAAHIAAVIKHALIDRHNLLPRMWWTKTYKQDS